MNKDRSQTRVIRMPKLHSDSEPADVWFEAGMIYFESPRDPNQVVSCTISEFEERLAFIRDCVAEGDMHAQLDCDKRDVERFLAQAEVLIAESRRQLHVGLPLDTLIEIEQQRKPISSGTGGFVARESGLLVPT